MKALCKLMLLFCVVAPAIAQAPDTLWTKRYGRSSDDYSKEAIICANGGLMIAGSTFIPGFGYQLSLLRTNANGDSTWMKFIGAPGNSHQGAWDVVQNEDGGFTAAGYSLTSGQQGYVVRTDMNGDTLWTRTLGGAGSDEIFGMTKTTDGGFLMVGGTSSLNPVVDLWIIKMNSNGDTLWTQVLSTPGADVGRAVRQTTDGNYVITGSQAVGLNYDLFLVKITPAGDTLWTRRYGGSGVDEGLDVRELQDGGLVACGYANGDFFLVRTDADGQATWTQTYSGGPGFYNDYLRSVIELDDGDLVLAGDSYLDIGGWQARMMATDSIGGLKWSYDFGGSQTEYGNTVLQSDDGGLILAGGTDSFGNLGQFLLIRFASECYDPDSCNAPRIPGKLVVQPLSGPTRVRLSWLPVLQTVGGAPLVVDHYRIESDSLSFNFANSFVAGTATDTTFERAINAGDSVKHYFRVIAVTADPE